MTTTARRSDFGAAVTGMVVGGCLLFAVMYGIVVLTSHRYPSEPAAAGATE
ncbi:MAG TPA: hypothetical protein VNU46_03335 [Gemmatimonadaceae bacterium]|jgi:hypothetical protein|nr:hypothetical protein [Gemmatimonadaceae bacterium]